MYCIGIDLGTSAVKLLLVDETGRIMNTATRSYPLSFPHPGWSEQDPADWWAACTEGLKALLCGFDPAQIGGIGVGGQMHGLVALDEQDAVIRPAILWNDGRCPEDRVAEHSRRNSAADGADRQHRLRRLYGPEAALDAEA